MQKTELTNTFNNNYVHKNLFSTSLLQGALLKFWKTVINIYETLNIFEKSLGPTVQYIYIPVRYCSSKIVGKISYNKCALLKKQKKTL